MKKQILTLTAALAFISPCLAQGSLIFEDAGERKHINENPESSVQLNVELLDFEDIPMLAPELNWIIPFSDKPEPDLDRVWPDIRKAFEHAGVDEKTIERAHALAESYLHPEKRHMIGVQCRELDDLLRSHLKLDHGLVVDDVFAETPAKEAGVEEHDILLKADEDALHDIEDLVDAVQRAGVEGREITLALLRGGEERSLSMQTKKQQFNVPKKNENPNSPARILPAPPNVPLSPLEPFHRRPAPDSDAIEELEESVRSLEKAIEELKERLESKD